MVVIGGGIMICGLGPNVYSSLCEAIKEQWNKAFHFASQKRINIERHAVDRMHFQHPAAGKIHIDN